MPILHRREDHSGFYLRGRIQGSWITWQLTKQGEKWLTKTGFRDGDTIDLELLETLVGKGWAFTAGTGPGSASGGDYRPNFITVGEGVKHAKYGIGEIKEIFDSKSCRVTFFREYPDMRIVQVSDLTAPRSVDLARERSFAYNRARSPKAPAEQRFPNHAHDATNAGRSLPMPIVATSREVSDSEPAVQEVAELATKASEETSDVGRASLTVLQQARGPASGCISASVMVAGILMTGLVVLLLFS